MIPLAVCIVIFVAGCLIYLVAQSRRRTVAELLADALYAVAAISYSAAVAVDTALVAYRRERKRIRDKHVPQYAGRQEEEEEEDVVLKPVYDPVPDFLAIAGLRKPKNRTNTPTHPDANAAEERL